MEGTPVDHDPFAINEGTPVDHDPFAPQNANAAVEKMKFWKPENQAALQDEAKRLGPMASDLLAAPGRAVAGFAKPFANIAKWAGYDEPINVINQADTALKNFSAPADTSILGTRGPLSTVASLAGDVGGISSLGGLAGKVIKPISEAVPAIKTAGEWLAKNPFEQSVATGAGIGALGADPHSPLDVAKESLYGAGAGVVGHGIAHGLGSALDPELLRQAKMKAAGFTDDVINKLSSGQRFGGILKTAENFLQDLPMGGARQFVDKGANAVNEFLDKTKTTLKRGKEDSFTDAENNLNKLHTEADQKLSDYHDQLKDLQKAKESEVHIPFINEALKPLGIEVPEGYKGQDAMKWAQDKISESYNTILPQLKGIRLTKDVTDNIDSWAEKLKPGLKDYHDILLQDIQNLKDSSSKGGWLKPETWQGNLSDLSTRASKIANGTGPLFEKNYGQALRDLKEHWMDLIEGKAGSQEFKDTNSAHSLLQAPQAASAYVKNVANGGDFSPKDLLNTIKNEVSTKRFAGGDAGMEKAAVEAHQQIMSDRDALKQTIAKNKQAVEDAKTNDRIRLGQNKTMVNRSQEDQVKDLNKVADEIRDNDTKNQYMLKRAGYGIALGSGITGGVAGSMLGLTGLSPQMVAGGIYGLSRGLYNPLTQAAIAKAATTERPAAVKALGKTLKESSPLAGLANAEINQERRKNNLYNGTNVTVSGLPEVPK